MKKHLHIIFILSALIFSSCENEEIVNVNNVFIEKTVVQAEIHPDVKFSGVRFTKTLPLGVPYNIENAEIKNVTAYLRINNVQIVPLLYDKEGWYKPLYILRPAQGDTYELFATRDETFIYAKTVIPFQPDAVQANYNSGDFFLDAQVIAKENEVYAALWVITEAIAVKSEDYYSVSQNTPGSATTVRTAVLPEEYRASIYNSSRFIQVFAFDKSYQPYFNSRSSGDEVNDPFIQGGGEVIWNVQGDNTIGMFIGVTAGNLEQAF